MASWRLPVLAALLCVACAGADECVSGLELLKTDPGAMWRVYDCSAAGFGEQTVWGWGRCGLRTAKSRSSAAQCLVADAILASEFRRFATLVPHLHHPIKAILAEESG